MGIDGIQGSADPKRLEWESKERVQTDKEVTATANERGDEVSLSGQTQEFIRIRKLVDAVPDFRKSRVDRLRQEVARGTYRVPTSDIADAIVMEHLIDTEI